MDTGNAGRQTQRRVLVVDDERVQRLIVGGIAARAGFAVDDAESVQQARGLIADQQFNVVVLDLSLREGDGIELLRVLYESGSDPVLIFMSAMTSAAMCVPLVEVATKVRANESRDDSPSAPRVVQFCT